MCALGTLQLIKNEISVTLVSQRMQSAQRQRGAEALI